MLTAELVSMSAQELERLTVIERVIEERLPHRDVPILREELLFLGDYGNQMIAKVASGGRKDGGDPLRNRLLTRTALKDSQIAQARIRWRLRNHTPSMIKDRSGTNGYLTPYTNGVSSTRVVVRRDSSFAMYCAMGGDVL